MSSIDDDVHTARMIAWQANTNGEQIDPERILAVLGWPDDTEIRRWKQEQD